jgi:hypothetical protein
VQSIPLSQASREALNALQEKYKEGKVFGKDTAVLRDPELEAVIRSVIEGVGKDTKKFLNKHHDVEITGDIMYNMKAIVRTCGLCVCDYTLWDSESGTCTYLGSIRTGNCITA